MVRGTAKERVEEYKKAHGCFFWEPYGWQKRALEMMHEKTITAAISSNKIGKTAFLVNVIISWLEGYEPWTLYRGDSPPVGYIDVHGNWRRRSSLGLLPPVNVILTGEDWKSHIGRTLVPELKKWAPPWYATKKNEQGVEYIWTSNHNKSTLTIMSYSQDDDLFESFRAQGVGMDEPPPKSKYTAMSRGLLLDAGKTLLSLTPLKEAWILDDIVLSGRRDIGIVDNLIITDNPDLLKSDVAVLDDMGLKFKGSLEELQAYCRSDVVLSGRVEAYFDYLLYSDKKNRKPVEDKGYRAEKYLEEVCDPKFYNDISKLKILKFIKDIDPSDVPPRVFGEFKSLVGRVLKEFDDNIHVIKPFDVPTDWPVTVMIDFHLSTPQAISYWAVNRQEINYCVGETWENLSAEDIGDDIVRKIKQFGWNIHDAYIDPLSKGDTSYMRNALGSNIRDTFSILDEKLSNHGVTLHIASKDKDSGIKNIQSWLKGPNRMPVVYVFDTCERHVYEVKRWVFDDDGKPSKDCSDHFMENWYRYTLTGARHDNYEIKPLPGDSIPISTHTWMAA